MMGVNSSGRSGGLISIWDAIYFEKTEVICKNRFYLIIIGKWIDIVGNTIFANVYGPHTPKEMKVIWNELIQIKQQMRGNWLIFGDFNVVRTKEERFRSQFCQSVHPT